jgi:hypothetical protein
MHTYYDVKEMLHDELADIVKKGGLSAGSLETIDKLLNSIKNSCKIIMYERYDDSNYSRDTIGAGMSTERSYMRKRDNRGRYSRGYSYADDKHETVEMLRGLMDEVSTDEERAVLKKLIRRMDQD